MDKKKLLMFRYHSIFREFYNSFFQRSLGFYTNGGWMHQIHRWHEMVFTVIKTRLSLDTFYSDNFFPHLCKLFITLNLHTCIVEGYGAVWGIDLTYIGLLQSYPRSKFIKLEKWKMKTAALEWKYGFRVSQ